MTIRRRAVGSLVLLLAGCGTTANMVGIGNLTMVGRRLPFGGVRIDAALLQEVTIAGSLDGAVRLLDPVTCAEVDRLDLRPIDDAAVALRITDDGALVVVTRCGLVLRYERAPR